jgi:hypothetical protein
MGPANVRRSGGECGAVRDATAAAAHDAPGTIAVLLLIVSPSMV